jgi:hypothetical protein
MKIDPSLRKALTGISGIVVTPFDDNDRIAPARLLASWFLIRDAGKMARLGR